MALREFIALFYQKVDFMGVGICRLMSGVRLFTSLPTRPQVGWNIEPQFPSGVMFHLGLDRVFVIHGSGAGEAELFHTVLPAQTIEQRYG
jgi:hypothetical protein